MSLLKTNDHNGGFFSDCSCRLYLIMKYFVVFNRLPDTIDSSNQFKRYKNNTDDITFEFFENYNNINEEFVCIEHMPFADEYCCQFENYKTIDYNSIVPFVKKYFFPSKNLIDRYYYLLEKYKIISEKTIAVYYRGTDKYIETPLDSFESYYNKLNEICIFNEDMQILIKTDSTPFLEYMEKNCIHKNIIIIKENSTSNTTNGIHYEKTNEENYIDMFNIFATFLIISKCKYILCSSGNCSIWMMFYRGSAVNVYQNLNKTWL